jgi:hypothetical protein
MHGNLGSSFGSSLVSSKLYGYAAIVLSRSEHLKDMKSCHLLGIIWQNCLLMF